MLDFSLSLQRDYLSLPDPRGGWKRKRAHGALTLICHWAGWQREQRPGRLHAWRKGPLGQTAGTARDWGDFV